MDRLEQSIKSKLRTLSSSTGITFNELWLKLVLERFLYRLSISSVKANFIFKGGMLLDQYLDLNRKTKDLDFIINNANTNDIKLLFEKIITPENEDRIKYSVISLNELEHPHMKYKGYRILIKAELGKLLEILSIDIGVGDFVNYLQKEISILPAIGKNIFIGKIFLNVYPPEFIFSEKLETAVFHGAVNSRMKDYHDMLILINSNILKKDILVNAIKETFKNRETEFTKPILLFNSNNLQKYWKSHLRHVRNFQLPEEIDEVIKIINNYINNIMY